MELDLRWPIFLAANVLLIALLRMVNDAASVHGVYFSLPALLVLMPALHLPPRWGLLLCGVTALLYAAPYPSLGGKLTSLFGLGGTFVILFGLGYTLFRQFSSQLRRFRRAQILTTLVLANCFMVLVQGLLFAGRIPAGGAYAQRVLTDSLLSALALYPIGWWFIELQYSALFLLGTDPREDAPPE